MQLPCECNQQEDPQQKEYSMHLVGGAHHAALIAKYTDPLVYTGPIRVRTGSEILRITSYLQRDLNKITVPFSVLHDGEDLEF